MKSQLQRLVLLVAFCCLDAAAAGPREISLAGSWRFQLDRADIGVGQKWFERALPDQIKLPGTLTAQGIGDKVTVDLGPARGTVPLAAVAEINW